MSKLAARASQHNVRLPATVSRWLPPVIGQAQSA